VRHARASAVALATLIALAIAVHGLAGSRSAFVSSSANPQTAGAVSDFVSPTVSAVTTDAPSGLVRSNATSYALYAAVSDGGNPSSAIASVKADLSALGGSSSASMTACASCGPGAGYGWKVAFNATGRPDGTVTLTVVATDGAGNVSAAAGTSVTIDGTAPTVTAPVIANGATATATLRRNQSYNVLANASDARGIASVSAALGDLGGTLSLPVCTSGCVVGSTTYGFKGTFSVPGTAAAGSRSISATATDGAGNPATSAGASVSVVILDPPATVEATGRLGHVTVNWSVGSGATSYRVLRSTSVAGPFVSIGTTTATTFDDATVSTPATYFYAVRSIDSGDESADSAADSATTAIPLGPIVFSSSGDGDDEIYTSKTDGTLLTKLTTNTVADNEPAWSADGTQIFFDSARTAAGDIYRMNADGSGVLQLTSNAAAETSPAAAPDGASVAFIRAATLVTMTTAGASQTVLATTGAASPATPRYAPDGSSIVFSATIGSPARRRIFRVPTAGGTATQLTATTTAYTDQMPSYAPNGKKIAFVSDRDGNDEIYVANADGTAQTRITTDAASDTTPSWSEDGSYLIWSSSRSGARQRLFVANADASGQSVLSPDPGGALLDPRWRPTTRTSTSSAATAAGPKDVAIGDLDGDGKGDVAVANFDAGTVSLYKGDGAGALTPFAVPTITSAAGTYNVDLFDLNGDGKLDLITTNENANSVRTYLGAGNGTFTFKASATTNSQPTNPLFADINADGKLDIVTADAGALSVLKGVGDGTFSSRVNVAAPVVYTVAAGDFNADGRLDLAATALPTDKIVIFTQAADGTFSQFATQPATGDAPLGLAVADVDRDGRPDLLAGNSNDNTFSYLRGLGGSLFATQVKFLVGGKPQDLITADFNSDGFPDVATANGGSDAASVILNDGAGGFLGQRLLSTSGVATGVNGLGAGRLNSNTILDLAVVSKTSNKVLTFVDPGAP
jgi:Tol biopolymer transport system component